MSTVTHVSVMATAVLGLVLCYIWWRERSDPLIGWWGVAQLLLATGIVFGGAAASTNSIPLSVFGQALIAFSAGIKWKAVRAFEGRDLHPLWVAAAPAVLVIAASLGLGFDGRLILVCTMLAVFYLLAASEMMRRDSEPLVSRVPAVALLGITAASYLAWMPLVLIMPVQEVGLVYASSWMPYVVLAALLCRIGLSFLILAVVKERQELRQRTYALTDALTGLPNRRALFAAAGTLNAHPTIRRGDPVAVMVFDLDHFKNVNDTFGHRVGDRVLQLFAETLTDHLETGSVVGRLGGEEFAAILPGAATDAAAVTAESIRTAFAEAAHTIDGLPVAGTVSIGVAVNQGNACELGILFHRADGALYAAKRSGRNRVELIGPSEPAPFDGAEFAAEVMPPRWFAGDNLPMPSPGRIRRYRGSGADAA